MYIFLLPVVNPCFTLLGSVLCFLNKTWKNLSSHSPEKNQGIQDQILPDTF